MEHVLCRLARNDVKCATRLAACGVSSRLGILAGINNRVLRLGSSMFQTRLPPARHGAMQSDSYC